MRKYKPHVIYVAVNIVNNKKYIGKDIAWPNRKTAHISCANRPNAGFYFHSAIRKHGAHNFVWCILEFADTPAELAQKEIDWISCLSPEYNLTPGGEGRTAPHREETKLKIGKSHKGMKKKSGYRHTEETLKLLTDLAQERSRIAKESAVPYVRKPRGTLLWWNNGEICYRGVKPPDETWSAGRIGWAETKESGEFSECTYCSAMVEHVKYHEIYCKKNPQAYTQSKVACEYCGLTCSKSNHTRWHGDKCKAKPDK